MQRSSLATGRFYAAFYRWNALTANLPPCHQASRLRQLRRRDRIATFSTHTSRQDRVIEQTTSASRSLQAGPPIIDFTSQPVQSAETYPFSTIPRAQYAIRKRREAHITIEAAIPVGSYTDPAGHTVDYTIVEGRLKRGLTSRGHVEFRKGIARHDNTKDETLCSLLLSGTYDQVSAAWVSTAGLIGGLDWVREHGAAARIAKALQSGPMHSPAEKPFSSLKCCSYVVRRLAYGEVTVEVAIPVWMTTEGDGYTLADGKSYPSHIDYITFRWGVQANVQSRIRQYDPTSASELCSVIFSGTPQQVDQALNATTSMNENFSQNRSNNSQPSSAIAKADADVNTTAAGKSVKGFSPLPAAIRKGPAVSSDDLPFSSLAVGKFAVRRVGDDSVTIEIALPPELIEKDLFVATVGWKSGPPVEYITKNIGARFEPQDDVGQHDLRFAGPLRSASVSGTPQQVSNALDSLTTSIGNLMKKALERKNIQSNLASPPSKPDPSKPDPSKSSVMHPLPLVRSEQARSSTELPSKELEPMRNVFRFHGGSHTYRGDDAQSGLTISQSKRDSNRSPASGSLRSCQIKSSAELPFESLEAWHDVVRYRADAGVMLELAVPGYVIMKMNLQDPQGKCQQLLTRAGVRMEIRDAVGAGAIISVDDLRSVVLSGGLEGVRRVRDLFKQEESLTSNMTWLENADVVSQSQVPSEMINTWDFALRQRQNGTALIEFCLPALTWDAVSRQDYGTRLLQGHFGVSVLVGASTQTLDGSYHAGQRVSLLLSGAPSDLHKAREGLTAYKQLPSPREVKATPQSSSRHEPGTSSVKLVILISKELLNLLLRVDIEAIQREADAFVSDWRKNKYKFRIVGSAAQVKEAKDLIQRGMDRASRETNSKSLNLNYFIEGVVTPKLTGLAKPHFMLLTMPATILKVRHILVGPWGDRIRDLETRTGCDILVSKRSLGAVSAILIRADEARKLPVARSMIDNEARNRFGSEFDTTVAEQGQGEPTVFTKDEMYQLYLSTKPKDSDASINHDADPRATQIERSGDGEDRPGVLEPSQSNRAHVQEAEQVEDEAELHSDKAQSSVVNHGGDTRATQAERKVDMNSLPETIKPSPSEEVRLLEKKQVTNSAELNTDGAPSLTGGNMHHTGNASSGTHPHYMLCAVSSNGTAPGILLGKSGHTTRGLRQDYDAEILVLNHLGQEKVGFYVRTKTADDLADVRSAMQGLLDYGRGRDKGNLELEVLEQGTGDPRSVDIARLLSKESEAGSTTVRKRASVKKLTDSVKGTLRQLTHPVVVLTSRLPGRNEDGREITACRGVTVSSFNTVTIAPIPTISFNLKVPSRTWDAIEASSKVCVHVLAASPQGAAVAHAFTQPYDRAHEPFERLEAFDAYISAPARQRRPPMIRKRGAVIARLLVRVDLKKSVKVGDHVIVVGEVYDHQEGEGVLGFDAGALAYGMQGYRELGDSVTPIELDEKKDDEVDDVPDGATDHEADRQLHEVVGDTVDDGTAGQVRLVPDDRYDDIGTEDADEDQAGEIAPEESAARETLSDDTSTESFKQDLPNEDGNTLTDMEHNTTILQYQPADQNSFAPTSESQSTAEAPEVAQVSGDGSSNDSEEIWARFERAENEEIETARPNATASTDPALHTETYSTPDPDEKQEQASIKAEPTSPDDPTPASPSPSSTTEPDTTSSPQPRSDLAAYTPSSTPNPFGPPKSSPLPQSASTYSPSQTPADNIETIFDSLDLEKQQQRRQATARRTPWGLKSWEN